MSPEPFASAIRARGPQSLTSVLPFYYFSALKATTRIDDASPRFTYDGGSITTDFPATKQYYAETGQ